jgi:hypothetical protein
LPGYPPGLIGRIEQKRPNKLRPGIQINSSLATHQADRRVYEEIIIIIKKKKTKAKAELISQ